MTTAPSILVIGFGNPGRQDDGLGPQFADRIGERALPGVDVQIDYQLSVEHAAEVAAYDVVIFADAARDADDAFYLRPITPESKMGFTTHSVSPATVLGLAHGLLRAQTRGYLLGIRGECFDDFGENLSSAARQNLAAAEDHLVRAITLGELCLADADDSQPPSAQETSTSPAQHTSTD